LRRLRQLHHLVVQSVDRANVRKSVIYVDKAATEAGGAFSAFTLMHMTRDDGYVIEEVRRGQWSALERERRLLQMVQSAAGFCNILSVYVEQEPGSGGKESAEATVRMLKGHRAYCDRVTGSKETRAEPFAAAVVGEGKNEGVVRRGVGVMCGDGVLAPTPQPFNAVSASTPTPHRW
jgi:phage terminase large subunit-like protein